MQQLIKELKDFDGLIQDERDQHFKRGIRSAITIAERILKKEKGIMCAFAEQCLDSIPRDYSGVEDVYNETFYNKYDQLL